MSAHHHLGSAERMKAVGAGSHPLGDPPSRPLDGFGVGSDNSDPYDLGRFLAAQRDTYTDALAEIRSGRKRSHWMWFVFPQIQGLGSSENARLYAITNADEARAYLTHPVLGQRLLEITGALLGVEGKSGYEIFGSPDDMKLRSSATLFASISPPGSVFEQILTRFFSGQPDPETVRRLAYP